jgi:hypothetical protein
MPGIGFVFSIATIICSNFNCGGEHSYNARCAQWLNMYECHQQNYGDIHTKDYMQALKLGHNLNTPIKSKPKKRLTDLFK